MNRIWANHFGIGLVDPVDDFSVNNTPSHPEVLDLLAKEFIAHDFDVKFIIRVIAATEAYNLTSRMTDESQKTPGMFARMAVKALSPEQIFDSIAQATGYQQPFNPEEPLNFNNDTSRQEFIENFANSSEGATERQSTILQALSLMNGQFVAEATDLSESRTLAAVVEAPFLSTEQKIDALFLATFSRPITPDEQVTFAAHVDAADGEAAATRGVRRHLLGTAQQQRVFDESLTNVWTSRTMNGYQTWTWKSTVWRRPAWQHQRKHSLREPVLWLSRGSPAANHRRSPS